MATKGSNDFVHLHTHMHTSAFDGLGTGQDFARRLAEMGHKAMALTDHGTLRGLYEANLACKDHGIKLIPGCEFYVADDKAAILADYAADPDAGKVAVQAAEAARRSRDHVTVWATSAVGLRNLYRLSAWSWGPGFYYKPRIDMARLREHQEGLAVSTGCPGGIVASPLAAGKITTALDRAESLAGIFGDRLYVEIMPHVLPGREDVPRKLVRLADRYGAQVIATQDAHYPCACDAHAQEALLAVQTRATMADPHRFRFDSDEYWLRSRGEMVDALLGALPYADKPQVQGWLDNTLAFADRCTGGLDLAVPGTYLVAPPLPDGTASYDAWLSQLCREGVRDRLDGADLSDLGDDYLGRLVHELRVIRSLGFAAYFVAVWDLRAWSRSKGILGGPGRGSAAGSLVSYLLRITDMDPVRYGLSFERFLAPGRVDLPDIDLDFESERRDEVLDYLRDTYGDDKVAHISTHNTIGGKRALRDLARIYGIPDSQIQPVLGMIADGEDGKGGALSEALQDTAPGRALAQAHPELLEVAARVEGQIRDIGLHAAGVVMSSVPLADVVPVETRPRGGGPRVQAVAYDWHGAEAAGLVKLDVLGLRTLTTIATAIRLCGVDVDAIDLEDADVLAAFSTCRFAGVFQFDTPSARRVCRGFTFARFADVAVMTAINRPGPIQTGMADEYMGRAADPALVVPVHPVYDRIMAETYGVPVYQEQVVALARDLAGYTAEDADKFRKAISKKTGLSEHQDRFTAGALAAGMEAHVAADLWAKLVGFAEYAFNKAHAFSYSCLSVWTMYLKVHHPAAFYAAAMATAADDESRMRMAAEARDMGIPVRPPTVQTGGEGFGVRPLAGGRCEIVGGLQDVAGIGYGVAKAIVAKAPFADLDDLYARTAGAGVKLNAKHFDALARATALRDLLPPGTSTLALVDGSRDVWTVLQARHKARRKAPLPPPDMPDLSGPDYAPADLVAEVSKAWPLYVGLDGRGVFQVTLDRLARTCARGLHVPGEDLPGFAVVLGRVAQLKVFRDDGGRKSARLILAGADGGETVARMDEDVVADCPTTTGALVLCAVRTTVSARGRREQVEALWPADADPATDVRLQHLLRPGRTRPKDPGSATDRALEGQSVTIEGVVLRVRCHLDKTGGRMATVGVMGSSGYARFFVFASRYKLVDAKAIKPGTHLLARLRKLTDACCLGDTPCTTTDLPTMAIAVAKADASAP